jgi:hypothetical protein
MVSTARMLSLPLFPSRLALFSTKGNHVVNHCSLVTFFKNDEKGGVLQAATHKLKRTYGYLTHTRKEELPLLDCT